MARCREDHRGSTRSAPVGHLALPLRRTGNELYPPCNRAPSNFGLIDPRPLGSPPITKACFGRDPIHIFCSWRSERAICTRRPTVNTIGTSSNLPTGRSSAMSMVALGGVPGAGSMAVKKALIHELLNKSSLRSTRPKPPRGAINRDTRAWRQSLLEEAYRANDPALLEHLGKKPGSFSPAPHIKSIMMGADRTVIPKEQRDLEFFQRCPASNLFRVTINLCPIPADHSYDDVHEQSRLAIQKLARFLRRRCGELSYYFKPEWVLKRADGTTGYYQNDKWRVDQPADTMIWHLHVHGVVYIQGDVEPDVVRNAMTNVGRIQKNRRPSTKEQQEIRLRSLESRITDSIFEATAEIWSPYRRDLFHDSSVDFYEIERDPIKTLKRDLTRNSGGKRSAYGGPRQVSVYPIKGETYRDSFRHLAPHESSPRCVDTSQSNRTNQHVASAFGYCIKRHYRPLFRDQGNQFFRTWLKLELDTIVSNKLIIRARLRDVRFRCDICGDYFTANHNNCSHIQIESDVRTRLDRGRHLAQHEHEIDNKPESDSVDSIQCSTASSAWTSYQKRSSSKNWGTLLLHTIRWLPITFNPCSSKPP